MTENFEDIDADSVFATRIQKPNGEEGVQLHYLDGTSVGMTTAAKWRPEDGIPWQKPHYRRGLTEAYLLLKGTVWLVWVEKGQVKKEELTRPRQTISFPPGIPHVALFCPEAKLVITLHGEAVGNPELNNDDWYPAKHAFLAKTNNQRKQVEFLVKCQFCTTEPTTVRIDEE